jgi:hypothetical protein
LSLEFLRALRDKHNYGGNTVWSLKQEGTFTIFTAIPPHRIIASGIPDINAAREIVHLHNHALTILDDAIASRQPPKTSPTSIYLQLLCDLPGLFAGGSTSAYFAYAQSVNHVCKLLLDCSGPRAETLKFILEITLPSILRKSDERESFRKQFEEHLLYRLQTENANAKQTL